MKRNMNNGQQMHLQNSQRDGLFTLSIKKITMDWNDNLIERLNLKKESKKSINSQIEEMDLKIRIKNGIKRLFQSRRKYYIYILITKSLSTSQNLGRRQIERVSQLWTQNKMRSEGLISQTVSKMNNDIVVNQTSLQYSLRGGGCGVSKVNNEIEKLQSNSLNNRQFPLNFLTDLNKYLEIIISKAQFASDQQQKEEILIAIQWFICMKEHFNSLCYDSQSASSVYDLIFKSVPLLLKSLVTYIRISGFLCLQILQIINDLCRILFTFYMKNQKRYMDIKDKDQLDLLVQDFETQLNIESQNIWVGGAEFELAMIKAVIQSSPNNSDEGAKLLKTFLGGLVQSVLTMSPSEDLIDSLIEGAKFLYKENQVRNQKKNYEVYYYFESLKWYIIQLLREDLLPKKALKLLQNGFSNYIENNKEWLLNFCWVKFIVDLVAYRPIISKSALSVNAIEQQKIWNQLIKNKFINQYSFNKNLGRIVLFQDQKNQETLQLNYIMRQNGMKEFQTFIELLLNNLQYSEINLFTFKDKIEKEQKIIDYLFGLFQENVHLEESIENFNVQLVGLKQMFEKTKQRNENLKSLNKDKDEKKKKLLIEQIIETTQELIRQSLCTFIISKNIYKAFLLYFERMKHIVNTIEQDHKISIDMKEPEKLFSNKCKENLLNLQEKKTQLINSLVSLEVYYTFTNVSEINDQMITEKQVAISQSLDSLNQYIEPYQNIHKKLDQIQQNYIKYSKQQKPKYNEMLQFSVFEQIGKKIINPNNLSPYVDLVIQQFQAQLNKSEKRNIKLIMIFQLKYYLMDIINQINQTKGTLIEIQQFLEINNSVLCTFENEEILEINNIPSNLIDQMLQKEFLLFQQFFHQEEKVAHSAQQQNPISVDNLEKMLKYHIQSLEELQKIHPENQTLLQTRYSIAIVVKYLRIYIANPQKINQIKEQILKIYEESNENKIEQVSIHKQKQDQLDSRKNIGLVENLQQKYKKKLEILTSLISKGEIIQSLIQEKIKLHEDIQQIEAELNYKSLYNEKFTEYYEANDDFIIKEHLAEFQKILQYFEDEECEEISESMKGRFLNVFFQFCDLLLPKNIIDIKTDQNILNQAKEQISNIIDDAKSLIEDQNFKARQCYVISLTSVQTSSQEQNMIEFCQDSIVQIWATEKDERVKLLLKNKEFLEMQKSLFSSDLKSFSKRLQTQMEQRLNKMNDLEQKIYQEGDASVGQRLQEELKQEQMDFEDYLDNINDMSSKLDIGIQFLKDIKKNLTQLKQKIDKLQDTVNNIGDDVRKLRGKTFQELFMIRKKKVLEQMQLSNLNQIYIPLKCQEWDPQSGQKIGDPSILIHDIFLNQEGEINEFLYKDQSKKDVLLLRGVAGSGKSRAARKIEEFLWQKIDSKDSNWIPIYVSLPTLKEPKFNLIDQALESDYYQFDKIQVKEFKEAIDEGKLKIILILDSYDEMKQECIQSNLYQTNRFQKDLFGSIQDIKQVKEYLKVIITTRTEVLTSSSYQTWFYGESIISLKEVELLGFDSEQQQKYLEEYVLMNLKKEFLEIYNFMKQVQKEKISYEEFDKFWKKIFNSFEKTKNTSNKQDNLIGNEMQAKQLISMLKEEKIFSKLNKDQIINLQKKLMELWSSCRFERLINSAQIQHILTTPFMMEIVVQVLPSMTQKYSDASSYKDQFIKNYIQIKLDNQIETQLIQKYKNQRLIEQGYIQLIDQNNNAPQKDLRLHALVIWDQLQNDKFFQRFSLVDKITKDDLSRIDDAKIVIRALVVKQLTVFDFYMTFVEFYHHQQIKKQQELGKVVNFQSFMIDLFNFSQSLAIHLTMNELTQINYIQKGQLALKYVNSQSNSEEDWLDAYFDDFQQNGDYKKLIRSCILLTQKGGNHSFTHKSIQEFYVGHYFLLFLDDLKIINEDDFQNEIQNLNIQNLQALLMEKKSEYQQSLTLVQQLCYKINNSLLNQNAFNLSSVNYKGVLSLIKDEMKLKSNLKQTLIQIVQLSQTSDLFIRASSNSLFLLGFNNEYLGNLELKNIKISDIQLNGVSFYGSNLENSQFLNVSLGSCNFSKTNLKNAQWKNISCDELHSLEQATTYKIDFLSNGQTLVAVHEERISFWDIKIGVQSTILTHQELLNQNEFGDYNCFKPNEIVISPNDQLLAIGWCIAICVCEQPFESFGLQLVEISTGKPVQFRFFENNKSNQFIFSSNSTILALCCNNIKTVEILNINESKWISLAGHKWQVKKILFTSDNQILISCDVDSNIIFWNLKDYTIKRQFEGNESSTVAISLSFDGVILASCSGKVIKLWNISTYLQIQILQGDHETKYFQYLQFLSDNQTLVSWGEDNLILIWDTIIGKQIRSIQRKFVSWSNQVCFCSDYKIMAFQNQNEIELWDCMIGKKMLVIGGQSKGITALSFQKASKDGSLILASVMDYSNIQLWDTKIQKSSIQLEGHKLAVNFVGFSPDGQLLYSYGDDNTIRLWSSNEGKYLKCLENIINCQEIKFSNEGEFLFVKAEIVNLWYHKENKIVELKEEIIQPDLNIGKIKLCRNLLTWFYIKAEGYSDVNSSIYNKIIVYDINLLQQVAILQVQSETISKTCFSPDGNWLAIVGIDDKLEVFDMKTLKSIFTLDGIQQVKFSHNSQIIYAINIQNGVRLLNLLGQEISFLDNKEKTKFSINNQIIASIKEKQIILWNATNGSQLAILSGHQNSIKQLFFSPDGKIIASYSDETLIYLWDVQDYKLLRILEGHKKIINVIAFSHNAKILASSSKDFSIIFWDYREGQQIATLTEHQEVIKMLIFSPNDEILVSCDTSSLVIIWEVGTWQKINTYKSDSYLKKFVFSPDCKTLFFIENSKTICIFNFREGEEVKKLYGHSNNLKKIVISLDGNILVSFSDVGDKCILLWDTKTTKLIKIIEGERKRYRTVLLSNDDQKLAISYGDTKIRLYDSESGQVVAIFQEHKHLIEQILFSPDSRFLASCSKDFTIKLWDVKDVKKLQFDSVATLERHTNFVERLYFSPNSCYIISCGEDFFIRVWDMQTKQQISQLMYKKEKFYSLSNIKFLPDNTHLAYSDGYKLYILNYKDQTLYFEYGVEDKSILEIIRFANQGKFVIFRVGYYIYILDIEQKSLFRKIYSTNQFEFILDWKIILFPQDNIIRFWNVEEDKEISKFKEHTDDVNKFAISPDSLVLASCSKDTTIKLTSIQEVLPIKQNQTISNIHTSFKTLAIQSPMLASGCQIQGANIKSNMDWNMKQLFLQKGAIEKDD